MFEDAAEPRAARGDLLRALTREDLELCGCEELAERIELLRAEIVRAQAQLDRKQAGKSAADALFSIRSE